MFTYLVQEPACCDRIVQWHKPTDTYTVYYVGMRSGLVEFDGSQVSYPSYWFHDQVRLWLRGGATVTMAEGWN